MSITQRASTADNASVEELLSAIASPIQQKWDYFSITYVASGNGEGEIETITYKMGGASGTTVATLTLAYDSSDRLISLTQS